MRVEVAIFAGGCFWGVQHYFDQLKGIYKTEVGYTGGYLANPTYDEVSGHDTGHAEAVRIEYDPDIIGYDQLLEHFFRMHDPTQLNRQGPDVGDNYRSAIFYTSDDQQHIVEQSIKELNASPEYRGRIVTRVERAGDWWTAEDYHQKYAARTGRGMCHILPFDQSRDTDQS